MIREQLRGEFPLLETCTYLNSNSTGAMPKGAAYVLSRYWETLQGWRDEVWADWMSRIGGYADSVAGLIGAEPGTVVVDTNTSVLLARIASCFDFREGRRRIVITDLEFPSVSFLWRGFERLGAELVVVETDGAQVDEEKLLQHIDERTLLVCVSHGSYASGALLNVGRVARHAHALGAWMAVDAYQTVGTVPVDVDSLEIDFLLGGGHKWLCGSECGFLYVRRSLHSTLEPAAAGWLASEDPLSFLPQSRYAPDARRFSGGTPAALPVLLSQVGIDLISKVGISAIRAHSLLCTQRIIDRADAAGLTVLTPRPPERRGGVVSLRFQGDAEVARSLISDGYICSHRRALRVAPHFYNTLEEVDDFMDRLVEKVGRQR